MVAAATSLVPSSAFAHASERGHVLLLPTGHYLVGGAIAVAASFLVLGFVRAEDARLFFARRIPLPVPLPDLRLAFSLVSFVLFAVLVAAGFFGSRDPLSNPLPLVVWTLLWVGLTLVQGLVGNVWAAINPWYGPWRIVMAFARRDPDRPALPLPGSLGYWPAVLGLIGFTWFERIDLAPDDPARLAAVVLAYWLVSFTGMVLFGYRAWSERCEFLSVFFAMVSRFAMLDAGNDRRLSICLPGARLQDVPPLPSGGTAFILLALAGVSFDGLSRTFFWLGLNGINPLEFPGRSAMTTINTAGLAGAFVLLSLAFLAAVWLGLRFSRDATPLARAAGLLVWSLVPIALAYHFSHYLTALLVNGQYALVALSDPFSLGWDLFGTAHAGVEAGVVMGPEAAWTLWNLQAGAIIVAHVLAVLMAHALAARLAPAPRRALTGQLPLAVLMVGYTVLGLWLLSTPTGA